VDDFILVGKLLPCFLENEKGNITTLTGSLEIQVSKVLNRFLLQTNTLFKT